MLSVFRVLPVNLVGRAPSTPDRLRGTLLFLVLFFFFFFLHFLLVHVREYRVWVFK